MSSRSNQAAINRRAGGQQAPPPPPGGRQTVPVTSTQMFQQQRQMVPPQYMQQPPPQQQQYMQQPPPQQQHYMQQPQKNMQPPQGMQKQCAPQQCGKPSSMAQQQQQYMQQPQNYGSYQQPYIPPEMDYQQVGGSHLSGQGGKKGKISISDAIALTTLRLGRLETLINKMNAEGICMGGEGDYSGEREPGEIENSVVMSILSRLEVLETRPQQQSVQFDTKDIDSRIFSLMNDISHIKKEIQELKNTTSKLNSSLSEISQKVVVMDISMKSQQQPVLNNQDSFGSSLTNIEYVTYDVPGEIKDEPIDASTLSSKELDYQNVSANLKEYIETEMKQQTIEEN